MKILNYKSQLTASLRLYEYKSELYGVISMGPQIRVI